MSSTSSLSLHRFFQTYRFASNGSTFHVHKRCHSTHFQVQFNLKTNHPPSTSPLPFFTLSSFYKKSLRSPFNPPSSFSCFFSSLTHPSFTSHTTHPTEPPSQKKLFTKDHEWFMFNETKKEGILGITPYAAKALGDVVFVELPIVGHQVKQKDSIAAVESVKAASDVYAPMSGTIQEVNTLLQTKPSLINSSPLDQAWICKLKLEDLQESTTLMSEHEYNKYISAFEEEKEH